MKLENITDIFFDLDHTLWDFEKNSELAFQTIFKNHQLPVAIDDFLVHYPSVNKKYWALFREDKITHDELRYLRLKETFTLNEVSVSDEVIAAIAQEYIELLPSSHHLYEGTLDILNYLKPKYNLHIITNGLHEVQAKKLTSSKIAHYFVSVTDSESTGAKKPNPTIFNYALSINGLKAEKALMIGDCIEADVRGAIHVGMKAIHFDEFFDATHQDAIIINKLAELKKYL